MKVRLTVHEAVTPLGRDVLTANLMPAELRAAVLRALALIPGIRVSEVDGNTTTLEYRSGDWLSTRSTLITLDTSVGMITFVARTSRSMFDGTATIPRSVPDVRITVTTSVVDSARPRSRSGPNSMHPVAPALRRRPVERPLERDSNDEDAAGYDAADHQE